MIKLKMKVAIILALIQLSVIVKATWWAAAAQPVILGFGAILTALNLDEVIDNVKPIEVRNWLFTLEDKEEN